MVARFLSHGFFLTAESWQWRLADEARRLAIVDDACCGWVLPRFSRHALHTCIDTRYSTCIDIHLARFSRCHDARYGPREVRAGGGGNGCGGGDVARKLRTNAEGRKEGSLIHARRMFDPSSRTLSHLGAQLLAHAARRGGTALGQRVDVHVRGGERVAERGRAVLRGTAGSQPAPSSAPRASDRGDIIMTRRRAVVASSTLPLAPLAAASHRRDIARSTVRSRLRSTARQATGGSRCHRDVL